MRRPLVLRAVLLAAVLAVAACHQPVAGAPGSASRNVITREEIDASDANNVYELITRLRGEYLNDRGKISIKSNTHSRAVVFLNDQEYGILETMRNIPKNRIAEVRYYSGIDAVARFGSQYGGGVVLLVSRVE